MKRSRDNGEPLRLALVGCGRVTERCHLAALQALTDFKLIALVDPDAARLAIVSRLAGVERCYADYRSMLQGGATDVVAVCTPPSFHAEISLAALDAGKHLFTEKPLALNLEEADRIVGRCAAGAGLAMVGFNMRWHRLVRRAARLIAEGALGTPVTIHSSFNSRPAITSGDSDWRRCPGIGGGVLLDLGIHHFDLWRYLMRSEVEEVFVRRRRDEPGIEIIALSATMANGVLITASFSHGIGDSNELEVCGTRGRLSLSCYHFDGLRLDRNEPRGSLGSWADAAERVLRNAPSGLRRWRRGGDIMASYHAQWRHFVEAIRGRAQLESGVEDGRSALRIAMAAIQSASIGRAVKVAQAQRSIASLAAR